MDPAQRPVHANRGRRDLAAEWDGEEYARLSALQEAMAEEALALLELQGEESVLDVGCNNGKVLPPISPLPCQRAAWLPWIARSM
jgi:hypothetical protein